MANLAGPALKVYVAILEDHQSIVDGYLYRLRMTPEIVVVGTAKFADELEPLLAAHRVDVLLLDAKIPTSRAEPMPFPMLQMIPRLLQNYPALSPLVISMHLEGPLIRAVMEAGASGYILKDDQATLRELGTVVLSVAGGGIYLSQQAHQLLLRRSPRGKPLALAPRELEALLLCAAQPSASTGDLAAQMKVTHSTFRNLLSSAYMRLEVRNRAAAVSRARQLGLLDSAPDL